MTSLIYIIRFIAVIWCSLGLIVIFREIRHNNRSVFCYAYLLFYVFFVLPLLVHSIYNFEYESFYKANDALKDVFSNFIYCLFLCVITLLVFYKYNKVHLKPTKGTRVKIRKEYQVPNRVARACFGFIVFTFLLIMFKNGFSLLFKGYGYRLDDPSVEIYEPLITVSILFYFVLLFYSSKKCIIERLISTVLVIIFLYIHGKRFILAQFAILLIYSIFMSKRIKGTTLLFLFGLSFVAVIGFAYLYGMVFKKNVNSLVEYVLIDLSRHYTLMYQFYCEKIGRAISLHRFDAIIADILSIVPRSLWKNKPYPFSNSITRSLVGLPVANENIGWSTTITIFSDLFDSFSYFGLIIGAIALVAILRKVDKAEHVLFQVLGCYLITCIFTVQFAAYITPVLIYAVLSIIMVELLYNNVYILRRSFYEKDVIGQKREIRC